MVIMSGCSSVTRSFNSSCLFVMLLIFSCRSVKVIDYGVMWLHASVLLSEWSGRRGEVYDFGGLGCSQRLPLSV